MKKCKVSFCSEPAIERPSFEAGELCASHTAEWVGAPEADRSLLIAGTADIHNKDVAKVLKKRIRAAFQDFLTRIDAEHRNGGKHE